MIKLNQSADIARCYFTQQENTMNTRNRSVLNITAVAVATIILTASSAPLSLAATVGIDWGQLGSPADQGAPFIEQVLSDADHASHTLTDALGVGKDVTYQISGNERSRRRDAITAGTEVGFNNLLRDFIGTDNTPLDVALSLTLPSGIYDLTTYHHNSSGTADNSGVDIDVDVTDVFGLSLAVDTINSSFGTTVNSFGTFATQVVSNGVDSVLINYNVAGTAGDHWPVNGILIEEVPPPPVPEPSSFLLLGLGVLGLVRHTRRRRWRA